MVGFQVIDQELHELMTNLFCRLELDQTVFKLIQSAAAYRHHSIGAPATGLLVEGAQYSVQSAGDRSKYFVD